ncbi:putative protein TPRXL [Carassius gibelio]|uniref:putative protein TPRXL n=1 Tax=Carassius gibelio TaxID=101364 RepID=UPI002278F48D|nr:putative protein TPRXL [Carassius gibelio]XP_052390075.1 putative protein TPRXL [Carassius gibelio]
MGCASSTQTTAQDTTRLDTKQDGNTSGTNNENGGPAADSETVPDQTQAEESPQTSSAAPVASDEIQSSAAAVAHSEPEAAASDQPAEPESNPSTTADNTEEPAPSENTTEAQAESSPPEEAPASGGEG